MALSYLNTNAEAKAELQTLPAAVEMLVVLQYISPSSEINSAEPRLAEIEIQLILIVLGQHPFPIKPPAVKEKNF